MPEAARRRLDQQQAQLRDAVQRPRRSSSSRAWTRKTQPTLTPSRSAIQQASRAGVEALDEAAAMCATSASKLMSQPYSRA